MSQQKQPYMPFYPGDWKKDMGVQMLSFHDRQVWFEMMMLMHDSEERGVLIVGGVPLEAEEIARLIGLDKQIFLQAFEQIKKRGVCSIRDDGAIYSRSMVRRAGVSVKRSISGAKGGNPVLLNQNPQQASYPNADIDIDNVIEDQSKKNGALEAAHPALTAIAEPQPPPDGTDPEVWSVTESALEPDSAPALQRDSRFVNAGRKPMKKYPDIWLTRHELADWMMIYLRLGVQKNQLDIGFKKTQAKILTYRQEGKRVQSVSAYNWGTGFILQEVLSELKLSTDLSRSEIYKQAART